MSNAILNAQASSAVCATIRESTLTNPFVYNEQGRLGPPHSVQLLPVNVTGGTVAASKSVAYDVPKNGILTGVYLNLSMPEIGINNTTDTVTAGMDQAAGGDANTQPLPVHSHTEGNVTVNSGDASTGTAHTHSVNVGTVVTGSVASDTLGFHALGAYQMIESVTLQTSGRVIEQLDRPAILARLSDLPYGKRRACEEAARMGGNPDHYNEKYSIVVYLPLFFTVFGDVRYSMNTIFQEPMRIIIKFSDCKCLQRTATANDFTAHVPTDAELLLMYRQLSDKDLDATISANYGDGQLSMICPIMKSEATHIVKSAASPKTHTSTTIDLKENDAIQKMYLMVTDMRDEHIPGAANGSYGAALTRGAPRRITSIELRFNNTSVMVAPGDFFQFFGRTSGFGDGTIASGFSNLQYVYCIDFASLPGFGTSNCVALREISSPKLIITFEHSANDLNHECHVRYESRAFLTVNSNSGRVALSISS